MKGTVRALLAALGLAAPAKADPRIDRHVTEGMAELAVPGAAGLGAGLTVILVSSLSPGGGLAEFAALPFHSTWWGMLPELALSLLFLIGGLFASALVLLVRRRGRVAPDQLKTALSMQGADI